MMFKNPMRIAPLPFGFTLSLFFSTSPKEKKESSQY
jgi:hypothetical protein